MSAGDPPRSSKMTSCLVSVELIFKTCAGCGTATPTTAYGTHPSLGSWPSSRDSFLQAGDSSLRSGELSPQPRELFSRSGELSPQAEKLSLEPEEVSPQATKQAFPLRSGHRRLGRSCPGFLSDSLRLSTGPAVPGSNANRKPNQPCLIRSDGIPRPYFGTQGRPSPGTVRPSIRQLQHLNHHLP